MPLCVMGVFLLTAFKIFSLILVFSTLIMMYKPVLFFFLKVDSNEALLNFWDLWFYSLHQIWKNF